MPDALGVLSAVVRGLDAVPAALQVGTALHQATSRRCDRCLSKGLVIDGSTGLLIPCTCTVRRERARDYLKSDGWRVGLDLVRPGLGSSIGEAIDRARGAIEQSRAIVRAEDGNPARPPWRSLQNGLKRASWGSIPIFGRRGGGKTMTALRLAEVAATENGYPVEGVNLWGHDVPTWVDPMPIDVLVERMELVKRALQFGRLMTQPGLVSGRSKEGRAVRRLAAALEDMTRRVILIDESSLIDAGPGTDERKAVLFAMNEARHLSWIVIYVGQLMNQVPKTILTSDIVILKEPAGDEDYLDRDEPVSRHLWQKAAIGFETIRRDPVWWVEPYDCAEAWCYVRSRYPIDYDGMMPIKLPEVA